MNRSGRARYAQIRGTVAIAAVVTAVVALPIWLQQREKLPPSPPLVLSDYMPVADDEGIEYEVTFIGDTDEIVSSVGTSDENLIVTAPGDNVADDLETVSIYDGTEVVAEFENVRGIALSDPGGTLSAWVEVEETTEGLEATAVAVNAATGQEVGRLAVPDEAYVMAVNGETVAISDGFGFNQLWITGNGPQTSTFVVENDGFVVGLTDEYVIGAEKEGSTTIYSRSSGAEIASVADLVSWDTDIAGDLLVGTTSGGEVRQIDLSSGAVTPVATSLDAKVATFSESGAVVVQSLEAFEAEAPNVEICEQPAACDSVPNEGISYVPNDALGQIISQSQ